MQRLLLALPLALFILASPARADSAKTHVAAARKAAKASNWNKALEEWQAAYRIEPNSDYLIGMGDAYAAMGDKANARTQYNAYLADPLALDQDGVKGKLAALDKPGGDDLSLDLSGPKPAPAASNDLGLDLAGPAPAADTGKGKKKKGKATASNDLGLDLTAPAPAGGGLDLPVAPAAKPAPGADALSLDLAAPTPAPAPQKVATATPPPAAKPAPAPDALSLDLAAPTPAPAKPAPAAPAPAPAKVAVASPPPSKPAATQPPVTHTAPAPVVHQQPAPVEAAAPSHGEPKVVEHNNRVIAYVTAGLAVGSLAVGGLYYSKASQNQTDLTSQIRPGAQQQALIEQQETNKSLALAGILAGVVLAGVTTAIFVF